MSSNSCLYGLQSLEKVSRVLFEKAISICISYMNLSFFLYTDNISGWLLHLVLYIIDSIILILLKAITYNLYIYNQRGVTQLINIYFFLCFYNLLSRTL